MKTAWIVESFGEDDAFQRAVRKGLMGGHSTPPTNGALLGGWAYQVNAPGPHGATFTDVETEDRDQANRWAEVLLAKWPNGFEKSWDPNVLPGMQAEHQELLRALSSRRVTAAPRSVGGKWLWDNNEPEEKTASVGEPEWADIPFEYVPDAPPRIEWNMGGGKGSTTIGTARTYSAKLDIHITPNPNGKGATFRAWYNHHPSGAELAAGATSDRSFVLDEGTTSGSGEWGYTTPDSGPGKIWLELGAVFLWSAVHDAVGPFDWPQWVKDGPESLPWYRSAS